MKNAIVSLFLLFLALVAVAQPVTRFRVTQLFPPTDTVTQYFIQAGSGRDTVKWVPIDSITAGETLDGNGIYGGDGTLPENVRASGSSSEYKMEFDSISYLEIKDWNEGIALRVLQDFSGVTKFGRGIVYTDGTDSLDISFTAVGSPKVFTIDATTQLNIDVENTVITPDSVSWNMGNATFTDSRAGLGGSTHGIKYAADYSGGFVSRSLVDKAYVDGLSGLWESGYGEAYSNTTDVQSMTTTFTAFDHMVAGDVTADWSWSTVNDEFTYSGATEKYLVVFSFSAHCSTSTFNELTVSVRENGTETTARGQIECGGTGETESTSGTAILTANNTDTFDLGGYWTSGTSNISIKHVELTFTKL